jgi:hypothetical protein
MNPIKLEYREVTVNNQTFLEPLLKVDEEKYLKPFGRFGQMRYDFLKEHNNQLFRSFRIEGKLLKHCHEIDEACWNRIDIIQESI